MLANKRLRAFPNQRHYYIQAHSGDNSRRALAVITNNYICMANVRQGHRARLL